MSTLSDDVSRIMGHHYDGEAREDRTQAHEDRGILLGHVNELLDAQEKFLRASRLLACGGSALDAVLATITPDDIRDELTRRGWWRWNIHFARDTGWAIEQWYPAGTDPESDDRPRVLRVIDTRYSDYDRHVLDAIERMADTATPREAMAEVLIRLMPEDQR